MKTSLIVGSVALATLLMVSCGQKGSLYLPTQRAVSPTTSPTLPASAPASPSTQ